MTWGCQVIAAGSTVVSAIDLDSLTMPKKLREQRIADAHLIAAAPTLLAACEKLVKAMEMMQQMNKFDDIWQRLPAELFTAWVDADTAVDQATEK